MKYKPTKMPITQALLKQKEWGWAIFAGIFEGAVVADEAKKGNELWSCGKCGESLRLVNFQPPRVCTKCGSDIDWVGIKTRLIRVCPTCNRQWIPTDIYCPLHSPAVLLANREVPL